MLGTYRTDLWHFEDQRAKDDAISKELADDGGEFVAHDVQTYERCDTAAAEETLDVVLRLVDDVAVGRERSNNDVAATM
jgi:hypothetical protein